MFHYLKDLDHEDNKYLKKYNITFSIENFYFTIILPVLKPIDELPIFTK